MKILNKILEKISSKIQDKPKPKSQKLPNTQEAQKSQDLTQSTPKDNAPNQATQNQPTKSAQNLAKNPYHSFRAQVFFGLAFCVSLALMAWLYYAFLNALCIAALLCIASYFIKQWFSTFIKSNALSSLLSVCVLLLLIIVPLFFIIHLGALSLLSVDWLQAQSLYSQAEYKITQILSLIPIKANLPLEENLLSKFSLSSIVANATKIASYVLMSSVSFVIDICFIAVFLFVFFYYGGRIYKYMERILPFKSEQIALVAGEINGVLRVVFFSTILNVCLQGVAFGVCAWVFGLDGVLLGLLYGICSLIPIIGGVLVWLPTSAVLFAQGNLFAAVFLAVYSVVFIAFIIDSVVKPFLIRIVNKKLLDKPLEVSEFVIFFAIFAGLGAFGFWGIIFGPAISVFFIALLRIYERDFA